MGFAENIKYLRESHGLKQPDIAKIAGVSFQAVSAWERGEKSPRVVVPLPDALGIARRAELCGSAGEEFGVTGDADAEVEANHSDRI